MDLEEARCNWEISLILCHLATHLTGIEQIYEICYHFPRRKELLNNYNVVLCRERAETEIGRDGWTRAEMTSNFPFNIQSESLCHTVALTKLYSSLQRLKTYDGGRAWQEIEFYRRLDPILYASENKVAAQPQMRGFYSCVCASYSAEFSSARHPRICL